MATVESFGVLETQSSENNIRVPAKGIAESVSHFIPYLLPLLLVLSWQFLSSAGWIS